MACGGTLTLKRSLEFDPVHSNAAKRPRFAGPTTEKTPAQPPVFAEAVPKLSSEQIAARISLELKRQRRRGVLPCSLSQTEASINASTSSTALSESSLPSGPSGSLVLGRDTPMLSLQQVQMIVERLMKECEDKLRKEYDQILHEKLTEQYEAFLKFNHDQLTRRFGEKAASYVS